MIPAVWEELERVRQMRNSNKESNRLGKEIGEELVRMGRFPLFAITVEAAESR